MFKLSRYIVPIFKGSGGEDDDVVALYSTSTGNYITLTPSRSRTIAEAIDGAVDLSHETLKDFVEHGFLVLKSTDEQRSIENAFKQNVSRLGSAHLTIAPTMNCNFGCAYCFEEHKPGQMRTEIQDRVVALFERLVANSGSDFASLTWFGGEPLMGFRVIRALTRRFADVLPLQNISTDIITNGFLLTGAVSAELMELGVKKIQVTLDGDRDMHDSRRVLKGSPLSTWDRIIPNICAVPAGLSIVIRVNVDWSNVDQVIPMCETLERSGVFGRESLFVSLGRVENFTPGKAPAGAMTSTEFAEQISMLVERCSDLGWPVSSHQPKPALSGVCQVDSLQAFVIDPTGRMYRCWADLENNGDVVYDLSAWDGHTDPTPEMGVLAARNPFDDPECVSCFFLPSCFGSCPKIRHLNRLRGEKECPPAKYIVDKWAWRTYGLSDSLRKRVVSLDEVVEYMRALPSAS